MKNKLKTMDRILVIIGVTTLTFIITMIVLYVLTGGIPDTLCTCYFSLIGGECGILGWIKNTKTRQRDRKYELEDREYFKNERNDNNE